MDRYEDPDRPLNYSYKSINNSLIDKYLLKHWWKLAFKAMPAKANANAVSMVGNIGSWLAFILLSGLPWGPAGLHGKAPSWVFFASAFALSFYHTLDALDGMQARRTGAAGPLGEFIDHWFDSFNAFIMPLGLLMAFPVMPPFFVAVIVLLFVSADLLTLEAVRKTGVLVFDPFSMDEGVFAYIALLVAIGAAGYHFWASPLVFGLAPIQLVFIFFAASLFVFCLRCLAATGGLKRLAVELAFLAPIAAWMLLAYDDIGRMGLLCGSLLLGFTASRFTGDLLRERLMGLEYPYFPRDLVVLDLSLVVSGLLPGPSARFMITVGWAALTWTMLALALQFRKAISRVEDVLGIGLFGPVSADAPRLSISTLAFRIRQRSEQRAYALREYFERWR
jgi:phosphatidylglycerophosphate synthase